MEKGKKFILMLLALIVFFSGMNFPLNDITVYADEEEEEDLVVGYDSSDGNIYNMEQGDSTEGKKSVINKALEYDPRVHYLVTYAFLADEFGVVNQNSTYNGLYYGQEPTGGVNLGVDTNPETVVQLLKENVGETDSSHEVIKEDENKNNKEHKENAEKLGKLLGKLFTDETSKYLSPHRMESFNKALEKKDPRYMGGSTFAPMHIEHLGEYFVLRPDNAPKKEKKAGKVIEDSLYYGTQSGKNNINYSKLNQVFTKDLTKSLISSNGKHEKEEDIVKLLVGNVTDSYLIDVTNEYRKKNDVIGKNYTNTKVTPILKNEVYKFNEKAVKSMGNEGFLRYLEYLPEYVEFTAHNQKKDAGKIRELMKKTSKKKFEKELKDNKELKKAVSDYLKTSKKVKGTSGEYEGKVGKDNRILGWMPVYPSFDMKDIEDRKFFGGGFTEENLNKYLNKLDQSMYVSGEYIQTLDKKARPLRLNDLFYTKKDASTLITLGTDETKNNYASLKTGKKGKPSEGTSIGKYAGIQTKLEKGFWKIVLTETNIKEYMMNKTAKYDPKDSSYNVDMFRSLAANSDKYETGIDAKKGNEIGIDTYGNIVDAQTGTILIPYWQNEVMKTLSVDKKSAYVSHSAYKSESTAKVVKDIISSLDASDINENKIKKEDVQKVLGDYLSEDSFNPVDIKPTSESIEKYLSDDDLISDLAMAIVAGTSEQVKKFNDLMITKWGPESEVLHIQTGVGGYGDEGFSGNKEELGYTNDDLRERIMYHLDYGFWDTVKLTLTSFIVNIYNTVIENYSLSQVFYTPKITDSAIWDDVMRSVSLWIVGFLGVYIVFMAFQVFRKTINVKDFIQRFVMVTLVILIPSALYSPLIDLMINKSTPMVVGKQMQQMAIIDYSQTFKDETEDVDPSYALLFGGKSEFREKSHDYIIEFFTTQHKNGYDITAPHAAEDRGITDQIRSAKAEQTGKWNKKDVVKVNVSMIDLFDWVRERVDTEETDDDLFTWLSQKENYPEIASYEEYSYDPNIVTRNLGILNENKKESYNRITASELFLRMYESSNPGTTDGRNLEARLTDLSNVAKIVKKNDPKEPITMEEVEALIRDLSLTRDGRMSAYGVREMGPQIRVVKNTTQEEVPAISVKTEELWGRISNTPMNLPNSDYLNMESIIEDIKPSTGDPREVPNARHVYNINEKVLNDYVNVHHVIRNAIGTNDKNINKSEFLIVKLNQFFRTNEELGIPMFPTTILPETYTLDTYTRMVYVPIAEYKDSESKMAASVGEYLALRDNPVILLFFFLPSLILLLAWGLLYLIVFGFLMVILTTATFLWNYVIKPIKDPSYSVKDNKSWLGVVIVIVTFGIAKLGLMLLWYAMFYVMNELYEVYGGFTYPYVIIHSIIIIAYIILAFWFVLRKVLVSVAKDPVNMGGEQLVNDFAGKLKRRGSKGFGGKDGGKETKAVEKTLENEGEQGKVKEAGIASGIKATMDGLSEKAVSGVKGLADVALGNIKPANSKFSKHDNGIGKLLNSSMINQYESIDGTIGAAGVSAEAIGMLGSSGLVGQLLSTNANGQIITELKVGDTAKAHIVSEHLNKQGVDSRVNKAGDVLFNSTGKDLTIASVRKNLFGGLVEDLHEDLEGMTTVDTEKEESLNYELNSDGVVTIPVGDKGLTAKGLDTIINSKEFSEAFIIEGTPQKDANGDYVPGSLDVTPRSGVNVDGVMQSIYEKDMNHREFIKDFARGSVRLNKSLKYNNIEEREDVYELLEEGMKVQEGKIAYDDKNIKHVNAIRKITKMLKEEYSREHKETHDLMTKAMAYTALGKNEGFITRDYNTFKNEEVELRARESGLLSDVVETSVYAGENVSNLVENIEKIQKTSELDVSSQREYFNSVGEVYGMGEELFLRNGGENKYDIALNNMAKAGINAGGDKASIENILNKYTHLGEQRNNANILPEEYNQGVENLFNDLQLNLQEQGVYTKVVSTEINNGDSATKEDKKVMNDYIKVKRNLEKSGVSVDLLEKMGNEDFKNISELVDDIEGVDDLGDGVVNLKTSQAVKDDDVARLIASLGDKFKED